MKLVRLAAALAASSCWSVFTGIALAQAPDIPVFPGAQLDREVTAVVQKAEIELTGGPQTFVYATDAQVDAVIAFYAAQGFRRVDQSGWEDLTQRKYGVRIRRVWMLHPGTPEHYFDMRDWKLFVGIERPYVRMKSQSQFPSPDNVVDRTGISIADRRPPTADSPKQAPGGVQQPGQDPSAESEQK
jgi:hypothetical protein